MITPTLILILAGTMAGVTGVAVLAWFLYTAYLNWFELRIERGTGMYREMVEELASAEREGLDGELHRPEVLQDLGALETALEEQARRTTERPPWLLDAYDRLGLIDKYVERLGSARRWRERALAAELLGRVGNAKAVPALLDAVRATRTEDADVRDIALRALARIADPRAIAPLIEALESAEPWLATHIADILTGHGDAAVDPLLAVLARRPPSRARGWAANVLGELRAAPALPALLRGLADADDEVRGESATALGRLGDRSAVTTLLDHLLTDPAPFVRARIASALGQFEDAEVTDRLIHALGDPAWWARIRSIEALEQIGTPAEPPLLTALDSGDREIRMRAAVTLERLGTAAALAARIRDEEDAEDAAAMLAKFPSAGARELIAGLLVAPMESVRGLMLRALRRAGRRDLATEIAQTALADPDPSLRSAALETLSRFRIPEAITAALEVERGDSDPAVRAAAIDACARMSLPGVGARLLELLRDDPAPLVRERAALAIGLMVVPGGEAALVAACLRPEPPTVHAAALLASGMFGQESIVARLAEMPDSTAAQESLRDCAHRDAWFRLLRRRLPAATRPELRAIATHTVEAAEAALARGMDEVLDPGGRIRLIGGLRALQGEESREALIEAARRDPSPEARTAALSALGGLLNDDELLGVARQALTDPSLLVRRAAVNLFSRIPPEKGLPVVIRSLKPGDDPTVFAAVADLAAPGFRVFADLALRMPDDGDEAMVAVRIARRLQHPDLPRLLPVLARSRSPEVREAIAALWRQRPETADAESVAGLILDPAVGVRRAAARAAAAIRSWSLLGRLAIDPDPSVRRETALAVGAARERTAETDAILEELTTDIAMPVRASAYAAQLVQGMPISPPPGIALGEVAAALRESADLPALREIARTSSDEDQRLAAGFALALLHDHVASEVARTDPFPSIRHRVGGALELAGAPPDTT
jgi:HEAT repeat protein